MQVVAGLSLGNLHPKVWDVSSPYCVDGLGAVMVSYAEFTKAPIKRKWAMELGLHKSLGIPRKTKIYLDNGAFYFLGQGKGEVSRKEYEEFVQNAQPDWYPIPQDYIPSPRMTDAEQLECLRLTMRVNRKYKHDGYVPVIHISRVMDEYLRQFLANENLKQKPAVGLGGIVPNLLRASKAMPYQDVLNHVQKVRIKLGKRKVHVFGIGGTATLHLAALLGIDSVDSSGWRNRAARGIIQLPGRGDRVVADLGNWRGRKPDNAEWKMLRECECPACTAEGLSGLKAGGLAGFNHRATHNLWTLLQEAQKISKHLSDGSYTTWYSSHVQNSTYLPLIDYLVDQKQSNAARGR